MSGIPVSLMIAYKELQKRDKYTGLVIITNFPGQKVGGVFSDKMLYKHSHTSATGNVVVEGKMNWWKSGPA